MNVKPLNKALAILLTASSAISLTTVAMAGPVNVIDRTAMTSGKITEKTGQTITGLTDTIYSRLTGKRVNTFTVTHPVTLYDYQQANSEYEDAYLNGALNIKDSKNTSTSYDITLGVDYDKVVSSPNANTKYEATATGFFADNGDDSTEKTKNYSARLAANYDRYFNPTVNDLFWYGKGEARIQQEDPEDYAGIKNPEINLTAGIGYGRVVNVTPMARAMRLIEALVENGNIASVPRAATYQKIAKIISLEDTYRSKNPDNYAQYWISDIEKEMGITLGASGSIKAYEVLSEEKISTRKQGWDVRAGVGIVANNFAGKSGNPLLELQANYYLPVSSNTQFFNEARVSAELDDDNDSYVFDNDIGLTYELSDRVDWENKWKLSYQRNDGGADVTRNELSSAFLYEISNSLDYETRVSFSHIDVEDQGSNYDRGLFMGLKYRMK